MTVEAPARSRALRTGGVAIVAVHIVVAGVLLWWSWRKWPDPLVDFGRELYVPWQITRGKLLYRDVASLFGPLSPYLNALWFSLFGVSLTTLVVCNVVILMLMLAGIHRLIAASTDRTVASAATLTILLVCGFSQYTDVGNYNFVTPYAHEATHGVALSVAAFVTFVEGCARARHRWFLLCGLCFGAALLTKPEVAIAAGAGLTAGVWTMWMGAAVGTSRRATRSILAFLVGTALVPLAFLFYFHAGGGMAWRTAARAIVSGWLAASSAESAQNEFYIRGSGLDDLAQNVRRMIWSFTLFAGFLLIGARLAALKSKTTAAHARHLAAQLLFVLAATLALSSGRLGWALPLIAALVCGWAITGILNDRRSGLVLAHLPLMMWSVFALTMLPKIALNARIYHYGFFLAMPALSLTVVLLLGLAPDAMARDRAAWRRQRRLFGASIAIAIVPVLALSNTRYRGKTIAVGEGGDRFYVSSEPSVWQGASLASALEWLKRNAQPQATLVALPEGVMINYLARRENPTRFFNFMPPETLAFSEHVMAQSLSASPPDLLLIVHKNTAEYGYASFGSTPEYGGEILPWVRRNYRTAEVIGRDPANADGYGIEILRRSRITPD